MQPSSTRLAVGGLPVGPVLGDGAVGGVGVGPSKQLRPIQAQRGLSRRSSRHQERRTRAGSTTAGTGVSGMAAGGSRDVRRGPGAFASVRGRSWGVHSLGPMTANQAVRSSRWWCAAPLASAPSLSLRRWPRWPETAARGDRGVLAGRCVVGAPTARSLRRSWARTPSAGPCWGIDEWLADWPPAGC